MLGISSISIPVTDPARSKEFYLRLGFESLADEPMDDGRRWVQLGLPGSATSITLVTWFRNMPPGSMQGLVLLSEDIRAEFRNLKAQGLVPGSMSEVAEGAYFSFKDPDGNGIIVKQRSESDLSS